MEIKEVILENKYIRKDDGDWKCSGKELILKDDNIQIKQIIKELENKEKKRKKKESEIVIEVSDKEYLKEMILSKIKFLEHKINIFNIQTENQFSKTTNTFKTELDKMAQNLLRPE